MGVVYAAHDERLDRPVAIKRIRPGVGDGQERERLWREARAAARVTHPNVCQLFEIGEDASGLFLAMELLEGEPLSARLARGALPAAEAAQVALAVLNALGALHQRGIVHRDLKPSNIFLSRHGVKLLDFGLARPFAGAGGGEPDLDLTRPGLVMGTPRYMSPEQIEGQPVGPPSDLFVLGAVLYEMVAAHPAFRGESIFDVARAIVHDEPSALAGSAGVVALDRIIYRALRKPPAARYATAAAFAQEIRSVLLTSDSTDSTVARPVTRLVVLPFRVLRPDPTIDFLPFALADAVSVALSGLSSLVVRSTVTAASLARDTPDIAALAKSLDVDLVLLGTLLSSADQVRVTAQLVQASSGTLVRAMTAQVASGEIFQLQDKLAQSVVESLSQSLTPRDQERINRDAPANAEAYELYLRANAMQLDSKQWATAYDLYLRCVDLDPRFAPAWARLGRCARLLGKFGSPDRMQANLAFAEQALQRALDVNPELSLAHNIYAQIEVESGRPREAMARLLGRVRTAGADPELFAGLVHACRYCGLLDASEAAYERARRLDPAVVTSVAHTFMQKRDWPRAMATDLTEPPFARALALKHLGRAEEGAALLQAGLSPSLPAQFSDIITGMVAFCEGRHDVVASRIHGLVGAGFSDPEALYHWACALAQAGDHDGALELLERCVAAGCAPLAPLMSEPLLDPLRSASDFRHIVQRARELHDAALESFRLEDGPRLLGLPAAG